MDYESYKVCMEVSKEWRILLTSQQFQLKGKSVFCEEIQRELIQDSINCNLKNVESILSRFMVDINCVGWDGGLRQETALSYTATGVRYIK